MNTFKRISPAGASDTKLFRVLLIATVGLWILVVSGKLLFITFNTPPSFDGAMNLEVAYSLAHGEGYRRMYVPRHPFPHEIQTKAPYILPAAAVFRIFGVGIAQSEVVNIIYFIALAALSCSLLRAAGARAASILGVAAILATPGLLQFGFAGYGEIPGATLFIAATAIYFWPKSSRPRTVARAFTAGILLALAYLTKTVMLIGVLAFSMATLLDLYLRRRETLPGIAALVAGMALPIAAFESWKLVSLGGFGAWHDWWRTEFGNILWQAGMPKPQEAHAETLIQRTLHHLEILSKFYSLPQWIVGFWVVSVVGAAMVALLKSRRDASYILIAVVLGTAAIYLVWWLAITPDIRAWLRRVMNGMLLANLGMLMFVWNSVSKQARDTVFRRIATSLLLVFPAIVFAQQSAQITSRAKPNVDDLLVTAKKVRDLPQNSYIFGIGWDSAPVIALFSGRNIINFNQLPVLRLEPDRPAYVIKQPMAAASDPINHAFSMYGLEVPRNSAYGVYHIPSFLPQKMEFDRQDLKSIITDKDIYPYVQGAYEPVPGFGIWLASDNIIVLSGGRSETLELTGYTPPGDEYLYADGFRAVVSFDGCRTPPTTVPNGRLFTLYFTVPADCRRPLDGIWQVRIEASNVIDLSNPQGDHRSLAILAKKIGFVDTK